MIELTKHLCPPGWDDIKSISEDLLAALDHVQDPGTGETRVRPAIARAIADMRAEKSYSIQVNYYAVIVQNFKRFWLLSAGLA